MATNIDKGLYQAPMGLDALGAGQDPIEIEIVDPEAVNIHAGDLDLSIEKADETDDFNINLADELEKKYLDSLAGDLAGTLITTKVHARTGKKPTPRVLNC